MPTQYEVISFLVVYIHFSGTLHFLPVVRLIECLKWTLQVTVEFLFSSIAPISVSAWVWKINDINPCIAVAFTSSWIRTTFIKSQHVCMGCSWSGGWSLILWDGPYFSVFLQECFAWSSRALAGQWLMSQQWRCSEDCRCTSQDKTPHKSTNYLTFHPAVYFSPFLSLFSNLIAVIFIAPSDDSWSDLVVSCILWNSVL